MAFKVPEEYRIKNHPHPYLRRMNEDGAGKNFGAFEIPSPEVDDAVLFIIASSGFGWEHVSVHCSIGTKEETPTWDEMCFVKDLFWGEDDVVMQLHPAKKDYVNNHKHTLHLWRPSHGHAIPTPPKEFV